VYFRKNIKNK